MSGFSGNIIDQSQPLGPPFLPVEGIINLRDIGGYAVQKKRDSVIRHRYLFRSGELSRLTPKGAEQLKQLGVKRVFDLRSDTEISAWKTATPAIDGTELVRVPVFQTRAYDPVSIAKRLTTFENNEAEGFKIMYTEILTAGGPAFGTIFRHIIERPDEPVLVHCTAGKDRTGIFIALLFMILDIADDDIATEYALTTKGLAPAIPHLLSKLSPGEIDDDKRRGALSLVSARSHHILLTLNVIRNQFGGAENYLKTQAGIDEDGIAIIRKNMLTSSELANISSSDGLLGIF